MTVLPRPETLLLQVLCCPELDPDPATHIAALLDAPRLSWGQLLEQAITHKLPCVLADYLATTGLDTHTPRQIRRFLASALRANQYKTHLYRGEAKRIFRAFATAGIAAAALNGIALESSVYGGRGARQLSDIDILVAPDDIPHARAVLSQLEYSRASGAKENTFVRSTNDIVLPSISVDLSTILTYARREISIQRTDQVAAHESSGLPTLSPQLAIQQSLGRLNHELHSLAAGPRLIACADALRLITDAHPRPSFHGLPESLTDAWDFLQQRWPQLNAVSRHVSRGVR